MIHLEEMVNRLEQWNISSIKESYSFVNSPPDKINQTVLCKMKCRKQNTKKSLTSFYKLICTEFSGNFISEWSNSSYRVNSF